MSEHFPSEPARARVADVQLIGHLLEAYLLERGSISCSPSPSEGFARVWRKHVVPLTVEFDCEWALGMTAVVTGVTSEAGKAFNGRVGRILGRAAGGAPTVDSVDARLRLALLLRRWGRPAKCPRTCHSELLRRGPS